MTVVNYLIFAIFPIGMAYAAASDLLTMSIPNLLVAGLAAGFVVAALAVGMDLSQIGIHVAAGGVVLAIGFACFAFGWIGGGDAKLAAVAALWLGALDGLAFVAYGSIFGGALTLLVLSFRAKLLPAFALRQTWLLRLHDPKVGVPYGIALAAAALLIYPKTMWAQLAIG